jgi:hypothetical protein
MKKRVSSVKSIKPLVEKAQRPQNNSREDIKRRTTDNYNPNNGPKQRSRKKSF